MIECNIDENLESDIHIEVKKEVYKIHESFIEELEKKLTRIKKKCEKYGNEFTYEVLGYEMFDVETDKNKNPNFQKYYNVKAVGTALINDWQFIAVLKPYGDENVIKRYETEVDLPVRFRESKNVCEHCNTERNRNELFVIRNTKTNKFMQVGRKCLKDYTNGLSAENVASYIEWKDMLKEYEDDSIHNHISHGRKYHDVKTIIQYALACTQEFGFFKTDAQRSTAMRVRELAFDMDKALREWYKDEMINLSFKDIFNEETDKKVEEIIQYYLALNDNSEFIHNIQVILKGQYCTSKEFGLIVCLPNCYRKAMEDEKIIADRKAEIDKVKDIENDSLHFGEIGKRYTIENMRIMYISSYETMYGVTHIYKIYDKENHIFVWKTSKGLTLEDKEYNVTFTVKNHSDYNGAIQTEVSRCKLV